MDFVYFVVLVGVLIFVHEVGHFAWAKFFGVKVLRFSLGFGPAIVRLRRGETTYQIAVVPLGGYVTMLGENPRDRIAAEEESRSFRAQPLWKRLVIVVAGPAMNLLFPVVLFFVVALGKTHVEAPVVGMVQPGMPADGVLQAGDRVVSIDDEEVETFDQMRRIVADRPREPLRFVVMRRERDGTETEHAVRVTPVLSVERRPLDVVERLGRIGVLSAQPAAVIGVRHPQSAAAQSGLRTFDVLTSIAGKPVRRWLDLERALGPNRGDLVPVSYLRPVRIERALGGLVDLEVFEPRMGLLTPEGGEGDGLERAGIEGSDLYVADAPPGTPEHRAGLRRGDRIEALDGHRVLSWSSLRVALASAPDVEHVVRVRRDGRTFETAAFRIEQEASAEEPGERLPVIHVRNWLPVQRDLVPNPSRVTFAMGDAVRSTGEVVSITALSIWRLLQGRVSLDTIGGPVMVYSVAGEYGRKGTLDFLWVMALVSINLGLLNLLPIPMLDGGHVLFFAIEGVMRRPLSLRVRQVASLAGLTVLVLLMVLAFKNDVQRLWPVLSARFGDGF
ncbi:MAG: RIP metalloprotease RseP [Deltaproteobacteria bacterium]|nr:RIP metalloprotease RseP [Deltaproteobacteria bacterium]